ncbi:MAG: type II toxin-antitoxin system HipA family toxin, partial [Pseudomonadales bacterium]
MTSNAPSTAYVWVWLPSATEPIVAGRVDSGGPTYSFTYGQSYLERNEAIALADELPLQSGQQLPPAGLNIAGCLRDAAPDAWGRRVILNKALGAKGQDADTTDLDELTYLLESGSDRIGALDFQLSPNEYLPRQHEGASLEQLLDAAQYVEDGTPLPPELAQPLLHGSSIGGARPKALLQEGEKKYVAKFSSSSDVWPVVKGEYIAMRLAALCGINAAPVQLKQALGKDALIVERFDRSLTATGWQRSNMHSALTLLGLNEMEARYASYEDLAELVRRKFTEPK